MTIQDQVFLYCSLLYEQQNQQILSSLPQERSEMLQKEAKRFDRFPKEVRLTLVSKLLGYLVQHVRNPHLERIHPSWIADSLRMEHPKIAGAVLSKFSPEYKKLVLKLLGKPFQGDFSPISAHVLETLFFVFSTKFSPMGAPWGDSQLTIETLYLLKEDELVTFLRHAGLREVASALSVAGKEALAALISRFPAEMQQDFLNAIRSAKGDSPERRKIATARLSKYDLGSMQMEDATLKIGLTKLGAVLLNRREIARKIAQRLSVKLGMILLETGFETEALPQEEEAELMSVMERLIEIEKIDKKYVDSLFSSAIRSRASGPSLTGSENK